MTKKIFCFVWVLLACPCTTFAQNAWDKSAQIAVRGFCECYDKYGIAQLSPNTAYLLRKLDKKKARSLQEVEKILASQEIQTLQEAIKALETKGSDFANCAQAVSAKVDEYEEEHEDDFVLEKGETDELKHEKAMARAFQARSSCKHLYYLFLVNTQKK